MEILSLLSSPVTGELRLEGKRECGGGVFLYLFDYSLRSCTRYYDTLFFCSSSFTRFLVCFSVIVLSRYWNIYYGTLSELINFSVLFWPFNQAVSSSSS